jgi:hypothetical protein
MGIFMLYSLSFHFGSKLLIHNYIKWRNGKHKVGIHKNTQLVFSYIKVGLF